MISARPAKCVLLQKKIPKTWGAERKKISCGAGFRKGSSRPEIPIWLKHFVIGKFKSTLYFFFGTAKVIITSTKKNEEISSGLLMCI
jgi:hypothetical protein